MGDWPNNVPKYVTTLPASPYDGQEVYCAADATNGIIWHLRYRSGASGSYKWEFVGGSRLAAEVITDESTSSTTYADLATTGPDVTVPLAGDYAISLGFRGGSTGAVLALMSFAIGATAAADAENVHSGQSASGLYWSVSRDLSVRTITAASTLLRAKYRTSGGTAASFQKRWLNVQPIRVG